MGIGFSSLIPVKPNMGITITVILMDLTENIDGNKSISRQVVASCSQGKWAPIKTCDDYCEYFTYNNGACKHSYKTTLTLLQNNFTALICSLVNSSYEITTESIKLVLDVEEFGMGSDLIVSTRMYRNSFFYASLLRHSMDSIEMPLSIFQPRI